MKPTSKGRREAGPTQRQLRTGELVRHALADILREEQLNDGALEDVSVTVTEVRMSPDLRHALVFVEPLGGVHVRAVIEGLNRAAKFLRGKLARQVELKFIPDLASPAAWRGFSAKGRARAGARHAEEVEHEDEPAGSVRLFTPSPVEGEEG